MRRFRAFADVRDLPVAGVFKDAAESGAHLERADLQRLLTEARSPQCRFQTVLVDDLSRLSRDLGNTWQIVFRDLATAHVRVIDVSTGMASDSAGARIQFGALALVNDTMLQILRSETLRGLEGRALAGFWAGGRVRVPDDPRGESARPRAPSRRPRYRRDPGGDRPPGLPALRREPRSKADRVPLERAPRGALAAPAAPATCSPASSGAASAARRCAS